MLLICGIEDLISASDAWPVGGTLGWGREPREGGCAPDIPARPGKRKSKSKGGFTSVHSSTLGWVVLPLRPQVQTLGQAALSWRGDPGVLGALGEIGRCLPNTWGGNSTCFCPDWPSYGEAACGPEQGEPCLKKQVHQLERRLVSRVRGSGCVQPSLSPQCLGSWAGG